MKKLINKIVFCATFVVASLFSCNDPNNVTPEPYVGGGLGFQYYDPSSGLYFQAGIGMDNYGNWVINIGVGNGSYNPYAGVPFSPYRGWYPSRNQFPKILCMVKRTAGGPPFALGRDYQLYTFDKKLIIDPLTDAFIPDAAMLEELNFQFGEYAKGQTLGTEIFIPVTVQVDKDLSNLYGKIIAVH